MEETDVIKEELQDMNVDDIIMTTPLMLACLVCAVLHSVARPCTACLC